MIADLIGPLSAIALGQLRDARRRRSWKHLEGSSVSTMETQNLSASALQEWRDDLQRQHSNIQCNDEMYYKEGEPTQGSRYRP